MKKAKFKNHTFDVHDWANFITEDTAGLIIAHELMPENIYDDSSGVFYWRSPGNTEELYFPKAICIQI